MFSALFRTSFSKRRITRPQAGFTLIELLVVIAIIAILAAILFPVFASAREKARETSCASNMKQLGMAVQQYVQDYDEYFPRAMGPKALIYSGFYPNNNFTWEVSIEPYVKNASSYTCPDDDQAGQTGYKGISDSYSINGMMSCTAVNACYCVGIGCRGDQQFRGGPMGAGILASQINRPAESILFAECFDHDVLPLDANGHNAHFGNWNRIGATYNNDWHFPQDIPSGIAPPGVFPNGKNGAVSAYHTGGKRSNFTFADGHVKSMEPAMTNPTGYKYSTFPDTKCMWDATRP